MEVAEDQQQLLRAKVQHLSGNVGLQHLECALSDVRSRFLECSGSGSSSASPVPHVSALCPPGSPDGSLVSVSDESDNLAEGHESSGPMAHSERENSYLNVGASTPCEASAHGHQSSDSLVSENELLVNEIVHEHRHGFYDSVIVNDKDKNSLNVSASI